MSKEIFSSNRYFTVYDYTVSHGKLLIRSDKRKGYDVNIDIIFFDTQFMQIFTMLEGLTIRLLDETSMIDYETVAKYLNYESSNLFELESKHEKYYIAASFVRVFENRLEFHESSLNGEKGREKEIATSLTKS